MESFAAKANGRVNLIGEHTDYNGGWVLPTAIPQKTTVTLRPLHGNTVQCRSAQNLPILSYELGQEKKTGTWIDYLQGGTHLLRGSGHVLQGFEVLVSSDVPIGSGLSSSAALEVAFLKSLRHLFGLSITDSEIALLGQRIENEFVGAKVGIMDQMACAFATYGEAFFLDTEKLSYERIALPLDRMDLIVINSGISHRLTDGGYNQRRQECETACEKLGVPSLRSLGVSDLDKINELPAPFARRARHVVTENQRVHDAVAALKACEPKRLGELFYQSHASMRDDYQVSIPEIDLLVELCQGQASVYGARLTGGGFGGSIVAIAEKGSGATTAARVRDAYSAKTGEKATILVS